VPNCDQTDFLAELSLVGGGVKAGGKLGAGIFKGVGSLAGAMGGDSKST